MKLRLFAFALLFSLIQFGASPALHAARRRARSTPAPEATPAVSLDPDRPPQVRAASALLIDAANGSVLYDKNSEVRRPIASTTKLMTALIIAEDGALDYTVEVQPEDTLCEPTKLNFKPGERYTRRYLLSVLLVHSCNDVARALARDNAGSIEAFAEKMNHRAFLLGCKDTHFVNPNGLPSPGEVQYSTARDLCQIARAAYANPILRPIVATRRLMFQYADGRVREFTNTNKVLLRYPLCDGMKTGYTEAAGHCLVSSATSGLRSVISICLGDTQAIWNDSQALLMWGLATGGGQSSQKVSSTP